MRVLVGCEESQAVTKEFRKLGHEAFSCDILPCSGGHPEWHFQQDIFEVINMGWDMMICFPPCTHLAVSGAAWFEQKRKDGRQQNGIDFFLALTKTNIPRWAIENPVGIMSNIYRKPDQLIQPYYFGDAVKKTTCLWFKNLPHLYHNAEPNLFDIQTTHTQPEIIKYAIKKSKSGTRNYSGAAAKWFKTKEERSSERSKTFPGIARAMANQWGNLELPRIQQPCKQNNK